MPKGKNQPREKIEAWWLNLDEPRIFDSLSDFLSGMFEQGCVMPSEIRLAYRLGPEQRLDEGTYYQDVAGNTIRVKGEYLIATGPDCPRLIALYAAYRERLLRGEPLTA
jgi:hypothetical protein